jgi:hypothetical protein
MAAATMRATSPQLLRHRPHPDRRFAPSECKLQRAIQYAVTAQFPHSANHKRLWLLDCPLSRAMTE